MQWDDALGVATAYRRGAAYLAGEAAHRFAPQGGNVDTCIGDAVDLGWKLAATINGWGGPTLLSSYEGERRRRALLDRELLARTRETRRRFRRLSAAGASREFLADVLRQEPPQMDTSGTGLGRRAGLVAGGLAGPVRTPAPPRRRPSPGARPPAIRLSGGDQLFDRFGPQFTLVDLTDDAAGTAAGGLGAGPGHPDDPPDRHRRGGTGRPGRADLVLVRPDQHIAWRTDGAPVRLGRRARRGDRAQAAGPREHVMRCTASAGDARASRKSTRKGQKAMSPTIIEDLHRTVIGRWHTRLADNPSARRNHWQTKVVYFRAATELLSAHPGQPLTWKSVVGAARPRGCRSTFYEVAGAHARHRMIDDLIGDGRSDSIQVALRYLRADPVEQLIDETKVWSFWPYRQDLLSRLLTAGMSQDADAGRPDRVADRLGAAQPALAAALGHSPPACAVEDLTVLSPRAAGRGDARRAGCPTCSATRKRLRDGRPARPDGRPGARHSGG